MDKFVEPPVWDRRAEQCFIACCLRPPVGHLEEEGVGQLLDVVAVRQPVVPKLVAIVPAFTDDLLAMRAFLHRLKQVIVLSRAKEFCAKRSARPSQVPHGRHDLQPKDHDGEMDRCHRSSCLCIDGSSALLAVR